MWTRRCFFATAVPALFASKGQENTGAAKRFLDAATEFEVLRVTDTVHNSWLPLPENRAYTRKAESLTFASDADGTRQIYRHEFKPNRVRMLTAAQHLNIDTFTLTTSDRSLIYVDGRKVLQSSAAGSRDRTMFEIPDGWERHVRLAVSDDGLYTLAAISDGAKTRVINATSTMLEVDGPVTNFVIRPRRQTYSFVSNGTVFTANIGVRKAVPLPTARGTVLSALWSPNGAALQYLLKPEEAGRLIELRELLPDTKADSLVAKTTQYGHLQRNGDGSVFLGASLSKASPHLLILVRSVKRELTLCEHRCSDAALTRAVFSPNSSRMAFQTDRHGKMTIYSMAVDRLIDQNDDPSSVVSDPERPVPSPNLPNEK